MRNSSAVITIMLFLGGTASSFAQDAQPDAQQVITPFVALLNRAIQQGIEQQQNSLTSNQVVIVQQLLAQRGYDVGPPDGVVGPKTMAVVAQLQKQAGVPITGVPDKQLLDALLQPH
jgi:peptidoglycan hydrolase-like protein with peptidoglycan-binding domain